VRHYHLSYTDSSIRQPAYGLAEETEFDNRVPAWLVHGRLFCHAHDPDQTNRERRKQFNTLALGSSRNERWSKSLPRRHQQQDLKLIVPSPPRLPSAAFPLPELSSCAATMHQTMTPEIRRDNPAQTGRLLSYARYRMLATGVHLADCLGYRLSVLKTIFSKKKKTLSKMYRLASGKRSSMRFSET
jgi:hypothetical protein